MSIFQTWKRRIAYGSTDMAGNIIWQMVSTYLLFYYTTVAGISAAFAGMLFFVVRFIDAFDALIYGYLIDHTHEVWTIAPLLCVVWHSVRVAGHVAIHDSIIWRQYHNATRLHFNHLHFL